MTDTQFDQLVKMLDTIRCGIIDVEDAALKIVDKIDNSTQQTQPAIPAHDAFVKRAKQLGVTGPIASTLFRTFVRVQQAGA